ncbi:hypothetical protein M7I_4983 [Glarea lozoyensis 74030]|uniref:Uncharacterized protein n=1 Tax=Glarea lozoyensis (strain ATCC 74030 / MF5533) TaxID=1104152 RepID=H0EQM9_GLAL7|nr:hypothetical protein M7I_4983 [Glarea lozoyensis 74030]
MTAVALRVVSSLVGSVRYAVRAKKTGRQPGKHELSQLEPQQTLAWRGLQILLIRREKD